MQMQEPNYLSKLSVLRAGFSIFNITWEEEIGEYLPDPEFFAWVLSIFAWVVGFLLSFKFFIGNFLSIIKNFQYLW